MPSKLLRKQIKTTDLLMWASLGMFLAMRISVLLLFNITAEETGADIEAVHTTYEANPIFRYLLTLRMANYIFQFVILPAIAFTIYFIFRRKVLYNKYPLDTLQFHSLFLFFLVFFNFINDATSLVGRLM